MIASMKTLKFMPTAVNETEAFSIYTNKSFLILMTFSRKKRQHDYRLVDGCFHKKPKIHVSNSLSDKQKESAIKQRKIFLF